MPKIGRKQYHKAIVRILGKVGYKYQTLGLGKILIDKNGRVIYVEVAGKNLPYFGNYGEEIFPWETYVNSKRLDRIESGARIYGAESWIVFCYAILKDIYKRDFRTIVTLNKIEFGGKFVKTLDYRNHMKPRSPSWSVVDLPREKVLQITCDPEDI